MSDKKLRQKVAAVLVAVMSVSGAMAAVADTVGTPNKTEPKVQVTFQTEEGSWDAEVATEAIASRNAALRATGSDASGAGKDGKTEITRTFELVKDDDCNDDGYFITFNGLKGWGEGTTDFQDKITSPKPEDEKLTIVGWKASDVLVSGDVNIYNGATLKAVWGYPTTVKTEAVVDDEWNDLKSENNVVMVAVDEKGNPIEVEPEFKTLKDDDKVEAVAEDLETQLVEQAPTGRRFTRIGRPIGIDINIPNFPIGARVEITMPAPKGLIEGEAADAIENGGKVIALNKHVDKWFKYDVKLTKSNSTGWSMSFEVTHGFSPFYFMVVQEAPEEQEPSTDPSDDETPSSGDDSNKPSSGDDSNKPSTGDDSNKPSSGDDSNKPSTPGDDSNNPSKPGDDQTKPGDDSNDPGTSGDDSNDPGTSGDDSNNSSNSGSSGGGGGGGRSTSGSSSSSNRYAMSGSWQAAADGTWKFLKSNGSYATNAWGYINNQYYYFDAAGNMVTGWYMVDGLWYYMNPAAGLSIPQGAMLTGWVLDPVYNAWFYLNSNGSMAIGWQQIGGSWYYLNPVSDGTQGAMAVSTYIGSYYVNENGVWVQ